MVSITKNITDVNKKVSSNKQNKYIVIHYTGNKTDAAKSNADYFKSVNRGASAHYFVDKTSIYQSVEDKDVAWAVGKNYGTNNLFGIVTNANSISIEMCSDNGKIADETYNNTIDLTKSLMKKYGIKSDNVVRHFDVCKKSCPGWTGWLPNNESIWKDFKSKLDSPSIQYFTHVADVGDTSWVSDGASSGVSDHDIEAVTIKTDGLTIVAQAHVGDIGWQPEVSGNKVMIGTTGQSKHIEAVKLFCKEQGVYYRVYQKGSINAWSDWIYQHDGVGYAGTVGKNCPIDKIQIKF